MTLYPFKGFAFGYLLRAISLGKSFYVRYHLHLNFNQHSHLYYNPNTGYVKGRRYHLKNIVQQAVTDVLPHGIIPSHPLQIEV